MVFSGAGEALACGVSGVGQAGTACSLDDTPAPENASIVARSRVAMAYTFTSTTLVFTGDRHADVERHAIAASLAMPVRDGLALEVSAGLLPYGTLVVDGVRHEYDPSFLGAASVTYRVLREQRIVPFVLAGLTLATLLGSTHSAVAPDAGFNAIDVRGTLVVGKHFGEKFSAFALGRAFGGPIWWRVEGESVNGTDLYHYQAGLGAALSLGDISLFVEGIPFGERAVTGGVSGAL
jgi:hypothetical protein